MQNIITARRIPYNAVMLIVLFVALAIGFIAGSVSITPTIASSDNLLHKPASAMTSLVSSATNSESGANKLLQAPMTGWLYYRSEYSKWYAVHLAATPTGPVIDNLVELQNSLENMEFECGGSQGEGPC